MSICCLHKNGREFWYFYTAKNKARRYTRATSKEHAEQIQAQHDQKLMRQHERKQQFMNMSEAETQDYISHIDGDMLSFFNNKIRESQLGV